MLIFQLKHFLHLHQLPSTVNKILPFFSTWSTDWLICLLLVWTHGFLVFQCLIIHYCTLVLNLSDLAYSLFKLVSVLVTYPSFIFSTSLISGITIHSGLILCLPGLALKGAPYNKIFWFRLAALSITLQLGQPCKCQGYVCGIFMERCISGAQDNFWGVMGNKVD